MLLLRTTCLFIYFPMSPIACLYVVIVSMYLKTSYMTSIYIGSGGYGHFFFLASSVVPLLFSLACCHPSRFYHGLFSGCASPYRTIENRRQSLLVQANLAVTFLEASDMEWLSSAGPFRASALRISKHDSSRNLPSDEER